MHETNRAASSNLSIRDEFPQQGVDARLPARTAAPQMLHGIGVEPDFYLYLWSLQFRTPTPGWLHSGQKRSIQRRIIIVDL